MAETDALSSVTHLELFHLYGDQSNDISKLNQAGNRFRASLVTSEIASGNLKKDITKRKDELDNSTNELIEKLNAIESSAAIGAFYLKLVAELEESGVNTTDSLSCFKYLLDINNRYYIQTKQESLKLSRDADRAKAVMFGRASGQKYWALIDSRLSDPPHWFSGTKGHWRTFIFEHAALTNYLDPKYDPKGHRTAEEVQNSIGYTSENSYPDWLEDLDKGEIPNKDIVTLELTHDLIEKAATKNQIAAAKNQRSQLNAIFQTEWGKSAAHLEVSKRSLFTQINSLPELLCALHAQENFMARNCSIEEILRVGIEELNDPGIPPEKLREQLIRTFVSEKAGLAHPELVALWLEKKFKEARILLSCSDLLSLEVAEQLIAMLEKRVDPANLPIVLDTLRSKDQNRFRSLFYSINPLASLLSDSDQQFAQEIIQTGIDQPIPTFITDLSQLLSEAARSQTITPAGLLAKVSEDLNRYSSSWLRNHWQEAYQVLAAKLEPSEEETSFQFTAIEAEIAEIENIGHQISQGNLGDWTILYSKDGKFKLNRLMEITGSSLDERETNFEQVVRTHKIPCSVPPASIIRWFDSRVIAPPDIEWTQWGIYLDRTRYKKDRHGRTRFIYQINPEAKVIKFHNYFKKSKSYKKL